MIVMRGMGQDIDVRGAIVAYGYTIDAVGGAPPVTIPTPYGDDNTDRVMRHDLSQWARRSERIDAR